MTYAIDLLHRPPVMASVAHKADDMPPPRPCQIKDGIKAISIRSGISVALEPSKTVSVSAAPWEV